MNALILLTPLILTATAKPPPAPVAEKKPVEDTYHGVTVTDDYRWLENFDDPKVPAWSDAQNAHARGVLDALPKRKEIEARLREIDQSAPVSYGAMMYRSGRFFAMRFDPKQKQPNLVTFKKLEDLSDVRVLLDLNALDPKGTTAMDWYVPSLDGTKLAVSLSKKGSESGDVSVFDVETGKAIAEVVPRVNGGTAGGALAWNGDGTGFLYTRYPRGTERAPEDMHFFQQVYFHKLGTPTEQDTYAIGKEFPRIAETELFTSVNGKYQLAQVQDGDSGRYAFYLLGPSGKWTQVARYEDQIVEARLGLDDAVYLLSHQGSERGKLLRLPLATPTLDKATVIIPEGPAVILEYLPMKTRLYVVAMTGGPTELRVHDLTGKALSQVPAPPLSTNAGLGRIEGDDLLFANGSFTTSFGRYRYSPDPTGAGPGTVTRTPLIPPSPIDFSGYEAVREEATSKDGTKVPLFILRPRGLKLNGKNPVVLDGYGGFSIPTTPYFNPLHKALLEQGVVMAWAVIRGGNEFGEAWHKAGNLVNKQNVFDDFYAASQRLVELGYTTPKKLAIEGGSNGGLLMGAELTQHPEAFGAVISHVGYYDMLRYETRPNGQFNIPEYGSVKDPEQFKALHAYSPYHQVKDGTVYPAILFTTGANDPRVDPLHSRKMTARLQAANKGKAPILLRTNSSTGHGMGTARDERLAQTADVNAFLFSTLGVTYHPVAATKAAPVAKTPPPR